MLVEPTTQLNPSYLGARDDVLALLSDHPQRVLDVGCSSGALGARLKEHGDVQVVGLEVVPEAAEQAREHLDEVLVGDVEEILATSELADRQFDVIVMADVLEHLRDPWSVLRHAARLLAPGGEIIASLPNVRHFTTLLSLIVGRRWPYRDRGIHDRTHLRFFAKRNVLELFEGAGLTIDTVRTNYRIIERPHDLNVVAKYLAVPGLRGFLAFQYLVKARASSA